MRLIFSGLIFLSLFISCAGGEGSVKVKNYELEVLAEYPHDTTSYTQGLFFHEGRMYETTGQYGESTLRQVDLVSGQPMQKQNFERRYFAEGSVIFKGNLYVLTWDSREVFVFDPQTFEKKSTIRYYREGWGLTTDGNYLIASDGSSTLFFLDEKCSLKKRISVKHEGKLVKWLNELEYIDGKIWANVYMTDQIVIINPETGNVEGVVDCRGLLPQQLRTRNTDVLNGIAYNPKSGKLYFTGKNWPRLYEVRIVEKN